MNDALLQNFWQSMNISTEKELSSLTERCYREARQMLAKSRNDALKLLEYTIRNLEVDKLLFDMYVWQRVDAVEAGFGKAIDEVSAK